MTPKNQNQNETPFDLTPFTEARARVEKAVSYLTHGGGLSVKGVVAMITDADVIRAACLIYAAESENPGDGDYGNPVHDSLYSVGAGLWGCLHSQCESVSGCGATSAREASLRDTGLVAAAFITDVVAAILDVNTTSDGGASVFEHVLDHHHGGRENERRGYGQTVKELWES